VPLDDETAPTSAAGAVHRSVPISALEHFDYCPRQAALIHVEGVFESNSDTVRGDLAHAAVDVPGVGGGRDGQRIWRSLPIWHDQIGMHGICDIVSITPDGPVPVEHKSGRYYPGGPADLQVAAQVLCLRAMFDTDVPAGLVFSGRDRRRHEVLVDASMLRRVHDAVSAVRALYEAARLPAPINDRRCDRCSLREACQPAATAVDDLYRPRPEGRWSD
jgi:CRISPR-associated exonuclease Cas4